MKKNVIPHLKKCFSYAVAQNKGDSEHLAEAVRSITNHAFDRHDNCGKWCKSEESTSHTIKIHEHDPLPKVERYFRQICSNSEKFCVAASNQSNESVKEFQRSEGIQYQPNCGINIDITALNSSHLQSSEMSEKNCGIVYFDLKTSDFGDSACILQIVAECNQSTFSVYVTPTQHISVSAANVTGLHTINGDLLLHNKVVETVDLPDACFDGFY